MNLRTTEIGEQTLPVVQETIDQPIVSNYPRSGFKSRPVTHNQGVFRHSLTVIREHPLVFIALGFASVLFAILSMEMRQTLPRPGLAIPFRLVVDIITSLVTFVIGSIIQYHISSSATALASQSETEDVRSVAKSSQAWGAVLALAFVTGLASFALSTAIIALYSALNFSAFLLSPWSNVVSIPLISLATFRFIFAPLIAATGKTGAIDAMRESIVLTGGMGLKAFGWTTFVSATVFGAQWCMRADSSVIGYVAFLIPLFMYVVLGVWYARVASGTLSSQRPFDPKVWTIGEKHDI